MKRIIFSIFSLATLLIACNNNSETKASGSTSSSSSSIKMPYEASYASDFTNAVSDSDLLLVLNTYKYWEAGDLTALRSTMGDSMAVDGADGFKFNGLTDTIMKTWQTYRDSLSSVKIEMSAWVKSHSVKDKMDYITTWYKETDTFKTGRVDSANYADINGLKNGKVSWFSSYRQKLKK